MKRKVIVNIKLYEKESKSTITMEYEAGCRKNKARKRISKANQYQQNEEIL